MMKITLRSNARDYIQNRGIDPESYHFKISLADMS